MRLLTLGRSPQQGHMGACQSKKWGGEQEAVSGGEVGVTGKGAEGVGHSRDKGSRDMSQSQGCPTWELWNWQVSL